MNDPLDEFLSFLSAEKGASNNTVAAYRNDLRQLATYMKPKEDGKSWQKVDRVIIQDFILDLKKRKYAETTVARKVAAIRSFFSVLESEGVISGNPTEGLASPRVGRCSPKAISQRSRRTAGAALQAFYPGRAATARCCGCCTPRG
jgi:integrase/recombinase XerD